METLASWDDYPDDPIYRGKTDFAPPENKKCQVEWFIRGQDENGDDIEWIRMLYAGRPNTAPEFVVDEHYKQVYAVEYAMWKSGVNIKTPLADCSDLFTDSHISELNKVNIFYIEDFVAAPTGQLQLGMSGLVPEARKFLKDKQNKAELEKRKTMMQDEAREIVEAYHKENEQKMNLLEKENSFLRSELSEMKEQIALLVSNKKGE